MFLYPSYSIMQMTEYKKRITNHLMADSLIQVEKANTNASFKFQFPRKSSNESYTFFFIHHRLQLIVILDAEHFHYLTNGKVSWTSIRSLETPTKHSHDAKQSNKRIWLSVILLVYITMAVKKLFFSITLHVHRTV